MVASVGGSLQSGNVNPFQKQVDEQNRNNVGKSGSGDERSQEAKKQTSSNAPASGAQKSETRQQENNFVKAAQDNDKDQDDRANRKTRGSNLDITV